MNAIASLWRSWRARCKPDKMTTGMIPSAYMAQMYLLSLDCNFIACPKCGTCTCRWATKRAEPIEPAHERLERVRNLAAIASRRCR